MIPLWVICISFDASIALFPGPAQFFVCTWGEPGNESNCIMQFSWQVFQSNKKQMGVVVLLYLSNCCICIVGISVGQQKSDRQAVIKQWVVLETTLQGNYNVINNQYSTEACCCRSSVHVQYSKALLLYLEQWTMNRSLTWGSKLSEMLFVCSSLISRGFLRLMWATSSTPLDHSWKTSSS